MSNFRYAKKRTTPRYSWDWSDVEIKLIESVKKYPLLYDCSFGKDPTLLSLWEKVGLEFGSTAQICRKRWYNLRKVYMKYFLDGSNRADSRFGDGTLSFLDESLKPLLSKPRLVRKDTYVRKEYLQPKSLPCKKTWNLKKKIKAVKISNSEPTKDNVSMTNSAVVNQEPSPSTSQTTVLTQDIIKYLIKSKGEESSKGDDIFQSIASFVPKNDEEILPVHSSQNLSTVTSREETLTPNEQPSYNIIRINPQIVKVEHDPTAFASCSTLFHSNINDNNCENKPIEYKNIKVEINEDVETVTIKQEIDDTQANVGDNIVPV